MNELKKINAGTTVEWSFGHELADGVWQFQYALRGPAVIDIDATAVDGVVSVSVLPSVTSTWAAGLYEWRLFASNGDDKDFIASGSLEIEADFAALPAGHDPRSQAEKMLSSIDAVLAGRMLSDHERYSVDGRSLDRIPIMELQKLRRTYAIQVRRQKRTEGGGEIRVRRIRSRFVNE